MKRLSQQRLTLAVMAVFSCGLVLMSFDATARGGGGHARTSVNRAGGANINRGANVNRSANINRGANIDNNANFNRNANFDRDANFNRNTNINRSANVNVNRDVDIDVDRRWNHPVGTAVAIGATAAAIGSIVYSLPPSCSTIQVNGVTYRQCGSSWYQPRYVGTSVQYVVVNSPY